MIRHPRYKVGRRLGPGVYEKCQSPKFTASLERRTEKRGRGRGKTDYGIAMLEKQRARVTYGVNERQFKKYIDEVVSKKGVDQREILFALLETRLDNVVYRLGLAPTRAAARQMVSHGHIKVNGGRVTIPSQRVEEGDILTVREGSTKSKLFAEYEKKFEQTNLPHWIKVDVRKKEAVVSGAPKLIGSEPGLDFAGILDFYKR